MKVYTDSGSPPFQSQLQHFHPGSTIYSYYQVWSHFWVLAHSLRQDDFDKVLIDGFAGQQSHDSVVVLCGSRRAGDDYQICYLFAVERPAVSLLFFVMENSIEPFFQIWWLHLCCGISTDVECLVDLGITPALVGFEQGICVQRCGHGHGLRR